MARSSAEQTLEARQVPIGQPFRTVSSRTSYLRIPYEALPAKKRASYEASPRATGAKIAVRRLTYSQREFCIKPFLQVRLLCKGKYS